MNGTSILSQWRLIKSARPHQDENDTKRTTTSSTLFSTTQPGETEALLSVPSNFRASMKARLSLDLPQTSIDEKDQDRWEGQVRC